VDAPLQMQRELTSLRQSQGQLSGRDFESIYARFAAVAVMNSAPSAIEYEADTVSLRGTDFSSAQLDALAPKLQYANLAVSSDAQRLVVKHLAQGDSK
jgi:general secretion pathway protein L